MIQTTATNELPVSRIHTEAGKYVPTPEKIREECEAIQAGWSNRERWMRSCGHGELRKPTGVQIPVVRFLVDSHRED